MTSDEKVTQTLAAFAAEADLSALPEPTRRQGLRTFVNWLGCAVGGAREETVDRALAAVAPFSGPAKATVLGRGERLDALHAALVNGISSHVFDYDDTHLKTLIHPAGPVASALLAVAEYRPVSGARLLEALIVGIEIECRIGMGIFPEHYDRGWHITGTAGVFGAAAATGRLIGLDAQRMTWALGIAATQSSGLREMFGTMCKSFHPGRAAQNGAMAAFLAEAGFDSSTRAIEAPRGFAHVLSTRQDYAAMLDGLGSRWESDSNSYKPFACGLVIHPAIDGCIQIRQELGEASGQVEKVEVRGHPLVLELTGKTEPRTGLEGKFSVFHAAACALARGDGSLSAFTDEAVNDPELVALRRRVTVTIDPACHAMEAEVAVTLADGRCVTRHVERAVGSIERPLTDAELGAKFRGQAAPIIGADACEALITTAWRLGELSDAGEVARASVPAAERAVSH